MKNLIRKLVAAVVAAVVLLFAAIRGMLDFIDLTTLPEDVAKLKSSLPNWAIWISSMPAWLFFLPPFLIICCFVWLLLPVREAAKQTAAKDQKLIESLNVVAGLKENMVQLTKQLSTEISDWKAFTNQEFSKDRAKFAEIYNSYSDFHSKIDQMREIVDHASEAESRMNIKVIDLVGDEFALHLNPIFSQLQSTCDALREARTHEQQISAITALELALPKHKNFEINPQKSA